MYSTGIWERVFRLQKERKKVHPGARVRVLKKVHQSLSDTMVDHEVQATHHTITVSEHTGHHTHQLVY